MNNCTIRATPIGRLISSAAVRLGRRGPKRRPNAPTQMDGCSFFVCGRPIFEPDLRRRGHATDARGRLLLSPGPLVCGTLASPPVNEQPSPLPPPSPTPPPIFAATLPAAAASTSAQQRRPCPQSPAAAVWTPGSKLVPRRYFPHAQPSRRPSHRRPTHSSDTVTLVGRRPGS